MCIPGQQMHPNRKRNQWCGACYGLSLLTVLVSLVVVNLHKPGPTKELQLASSCIKSGDYAQAEAVLKAASRKYPDNVDVANELAWTLYLEHRYAEAEPYAQHSVARRYRWYNLDTLEHVELALGNLNAAEIGFKEVLEMNPKCADSLDGLGQVAERRGRLADALSFYNRARAIKPTIIGLDDRIAHVQAQMGQKPAHGTP